MLPFRNPERIDTYSVLLFRCSVCHNSRLITAPGAAHSTGILSPSPLKLRAVVLYPPQNCGVRHGDVTFARHGHQVAISQFVAEVPTNAEDHVSRSECRPLNTSSAGTNLGIHPSSSTSDRFCTRAVDLTGHTGALLIPLLIAATMTAQAI